MPTCSPAFLRPPCSKVSCPQQLPGENIGTEKLGVQIDYYRKQTPPDMIEQFEARNCYDQELYTYACDRFAQQLARHRARPQRKYSLAPRLRVIVNAWLPVITKTTQRTAPQVERNSQLWRIYQTVKGWSANL